MDDRGCLAQPLKWIARLRSRLPARVSGRRAADAKTVRARSRVARNMDRWSSFLEGKWPRGLGIAVSGLIILASIGYGSVRGDHVSHILAGLRDARDGIANAAGFRVVSVALSGNHHVSREEVLATAGIAGTTSLPFLDVEQVREHLKTNPWIADATVLKLYPGELQISVKEREAFALWQKDGRVSVIADDGTVLEPYVAPRMIRLPLVVGQGAQKKAKQLLSLLDRYPTMRDFVHASVLVGERRWNLPEVHCRALYAGFHRRQSCVPLVTVHAAALVEISLVEVARCLAIRAGFVQGFTPVATMSRHAVVP